MGDGGYMGPIGDDAVDDVERADRHCYSISDLHLYAPERITPSGFVCPEIDHTIEGAILCGRLGPPCVQCRGVSEVLCDFPLGDEGRTCDRPLCLECAPTVGVDKNFCADHTHGQNMLLFVPPPPPSELPPPRRPRLPKAPPLERRHRVLQADEDGDWYVVTEWLDELGARREAKGHPDRAIQTWDEFVALFRQLYPLTPRRPRKR